MAQFECKKHCPYGKTNSIHPISTRGHGSQYNAAAIPAALAEEVADTVHSILHQGRIRHNDAATMSAEEIADFNKKMSQPNLLDYDEWLYGKIIPSLPRVKDYLIVV